MAYPPVGVKRVGCALLLAALTVLSACTSAEMKAVRSMPINHVELSKVKDGEYSGGYAYGGFSYEVKVTVADHQVKNIVVSANRTTKHARMAEAVTKSILEMQKNDVDVVSGATTTSKALLKAVENALVKGLEGPQ